MADKKQRGGAREGAGRPTQDDKAKNRTIRLTDDEYAKFKALGGAGWLRQQLIISLPASAN